MNVKELKEKIRDFPDETEVVVGAITAYAPDYIPVTKVSGDLDLKLTTVSVDELGKEPCYYHDNGFYQKGEPSTEVKLHPYRFPGESLPKKDVLMLGVCVSTTGV